MSSKLITTERRLQFRGSNADLFGSQNMFGTIAGNSFPFPTNSSFIPTGRNGETLNLMTGEGSPSWLGLKSPMMQFWAYNYCSPLAGVIDRLAEADSNGVLGLIDDNGIKIKNYKKNPVYNRVIPLLNNPNPLQTFQEFNTEQIVLAKIFGYCPVFALGPFPDDPTYTKYMFNLNPFVTQPQYNYEYDPYDPTSLPITKWVSNIDGYRLEIDARNVLMIKDGFIKTMAFNYGLPLSKIAGLDYFISNICAAMEADNVLLKKKGPLGVFSYDPKPDMAGWKPMRREQQEEIQTDLLNYGMTLGQLQYIVSKLPIKWNSMSFNVQELMTKETVRQGIEGICDRFGYPAELMSGKNATYENRNSAEKFLYQNNIIPFSLRRMAQYCKFFGITGLSQDFDHLPVLQEDVVKSGQARFALSQSLQIDWLMDMITRNEYREQQLMEPLSEDGELYYSEWIKLHPAPKDPVSASPALTKDKTKPNEQATP